MEKRRTYMRDFKIQACERVLKENLKPADVARQLEISETMLRRWVKEYTADGYNAFRGKGNQTPENIRLKKLKRKEEYSKQSLEIIKREVAKYTQKNNTEN